MYRGFILIFLILHNFFLSPKFHFQTRALFEKTNSQAPHREPRPNRELMAITGIGSQQIREMFLDKVLTVYG